MLEGLYHITRRLRLHGKRKKLKKQYEPYPHHHRGKAVVDHAVYAIGILSPMLSAQQSYQIHSTKDASGISVLLFGGNALFAIIWITYGIMHKEKPLLVMYSLLFVVNLSIAVGAMMYG